MEFNHGIFHNDWVLVISHDDCYIIVHQIDIHSTTMNCKTESLSPFWVCISHVRSYRVKLLGYHRVHAICIGTQEEDTQYMGSVSHEICGKLR
jgi:hypothetical protein